MGKFKKKTGKIEAEKIIDLVTDVSEKGPKKLPDWVKAGFDSGKILFSGVHMLIETVDGSKSATGEDFLIQGENGTFILQDGISFAEDYEVE